MLNSFSLLTLTEPPSALAPQLWQRLVYQSIIVPPDRTVRAAILLMKGVRIVRGASTDLSRSDKLDLQVRSSCVLIVENGQLLGILTERDIFKLSTERQDLDKLTIRDVMSTKIVTLRAADFTDISVAIDLLNRHHIRHLPVVDAGNCLVGLVTQESLQYHLTEALTAKVGQLEAEKVQLLEDQTIKTETCSDGSSPWIETSKIPLQNLQGETSGGLGTDQDITDRQQNEQMVRQQAERELVLREITQRIRKSLDLKTIFETSVLEIRQFMETDRVGIFKLNSDSKFEGGEFVAESVGTGFESILGVQIHNPDFSKRLERLSAQSEINVIHDIDLAELPDDELQFLTKFQVRANLVLPLLNGQRLWGCLCIDQCTTLRVWQASELNFVKQIAEQISIGIQQATLYEKVQLELEIRWRAEEAIALQLRQQQALGFIAQQIRNSLKVEEILGTATEQVKELMMVDRVTVFRVFPNGTSRVIQEVVSPEYPRLVDMNWEDENFTKEGFEFYMKGNPRIVADVMQDEWSSCLNECMSLAQVKSKIVAPILLPFGTEETHRWVNPNGAVQLWGLLIVHSCGIQRQWQEAEAQLLQQVADQLAIGIQQASLFEQLQQELIERQQAKEEIALQLRQQKTLGALAQQIRNSLNLAEILATATSQIKELMMVDRVSIYQVFPNGRLEAVEEVVSPEYPRARDRNWDNEYLSSEEFQFYLEGNPNVVFDLKQDPRSASLQAYIEHIGAKSKIVVPILLLFGNSHRDREIETWDEPHLWGLLSVHSCRTHRHWQDGEVKLVQQIADQLALAIHQASLFEKLQKELTEREQAETRLVESNQELALSNQELARATRLKDEFLASMSHELRTPLNVILGLSESFQDEVFGSINDRQQKSIITIEKSGKHLLALINDILDLSKMEANKFQLELIDVSIQSICQNSTLFIKELALKRQIRLNTQLPEQLKYLNIRVDDLRFRQVLINLLSNAVKFTPEGGSIILDVRVLNGEIGAEVDGWMDWNENIPFGVDDLTSVGQNSSPQISQQIAFSIIDTGIGIAPENMDKLFQSFVQIDSSLNRQYAGTGLGLSLVKRIVEMHGGIVSVQSEVGRGSCFTVSLPFDPSEEIAIVPSSPLSYQLPIAIDAEETIGVQPQTSILLVEDNEGNIETMTTYLESRGYRLIVAENGQQAISILEDCANGLVYAYLPDIILMDIQMPGMDGFEATRRIRQIPDYTNIPIIALTALAMPDDCQRCLDAGANQYMSKPVRLSQLVASIETLLKSI